MCIVWTTKITFGCTKQNVPNYNLFECVARKDSNDFMYFKSFPDLPSSTFMFREVSCENRDGAWSFQFF